MMEMGVMVPRYRPIPRYPQVIRDFSFNIDDDISVSTVIDRIKKVSPLIVDVGSSICSKGKRGCLFRVVFQSFEDTLKDETINALQDIILRELAV
jgi:phenylalanyl-tRNA synthetase beta chain